MMGDMDTAQSQTNNDLWGSLNWISADDCPACKSPRKGAAILFKLPRFAVFKCPCGHRYIHPCLDDASQMKIYQSSEILEMINPFLEEYYEYDLMNRKSQTFRDYSKAIQKLENLTTGRRMLEVGCGTGALLKVALERGWQPSGVDSGEQNIETLNKDGIEGFCCSFLEFDKPEAYDCLILWDLIEHSPDPQRFLHKAHELLSENGVLLLAVPYYPNLLSEFAGFIYKISGGKARGSLAKMYVSEHVSYFSSKSMEHLLTKNGFKLQSFYKSETDLARYAFGFPLKIILRILFYIARLGRLQNRALFFARKA